MDIVWSKGVWSGRVDVTCGAMACGADTCVERLERTCGADVWSGRRADRENDRQRESRGGAGRRRRGTAEAQVWAGRRQSLRRAGRRPQLFEGVCGSGRQHRHLDSLVRCIHLKLDALRLRVHER
eukprot:4229104-Prymnesium_polylepis.1